MGKSISLSQEEMKILLDSLAYTKQAFQNYTGYPSPEFKAQQISQVDELREKLKFMFKEN